jgi:hypothetical protein
VDLLPVGGPYTPPTNGQVFLNLLPGQDNARLTFAAGGIEAAVADPDHLDLPVSIALRSRATVTTDATHNPRRVTLKLTERTGLISGVGHLEDDNSGRPVKRQYHFNGLSVPTTEGLRNHGYFLLNGLVADEDSLSGQVVLQPAF